MPVQPGEDELDCIRAELTAEGLGAPGESALEVVRNLLQVRRLALHIAAKGERRQD